MAQGVAFRTGRDVRQQRWGWVTEPRDDMHADADGHLSSLGGWVVQTAPPGCLSSTPRTSLTTCTNHRREHQTYRADQRISMISMCWLLPSDCFESIPATNGSILAPLIFRSSVRLNLSMFSFNLVYFTFYFTSKLSLRHNISWWKSDYSHKL